MRHHITRAFLVGGFALGAWLGVELAQHNEARADDTVAVVIEQPGGVLDQTTATVTQTLDQAVGDKAAKPVKVKPAKLKHKPKPVKVQPVPATRQLLTRTPPPVDTTPRPVVVNPPPAPAPTDLDQLVSIPESNTWPTPSTNPTPAPVVEPIPLPILAPPPPIGLPVDIGPITAPPAATPPAPAEQLTPAAAFTPADAPLCDPPATTTADHPTTRDRLPGRPRPADQASAPGQPGGCPRPTNRRPVCPDATPRTTTAHTGGGQAPTAGTPPGHTGAVEPQPLDANWPATTALTSAVPEVEYRPI